MPNNSDLIAVKDRIFADLGLCEQVSGLYDEQWLAGEGRRRIAVHSPINGERLADVAIAGEDDYSRLIERAWLSFGEWSQVPAPKRGEVIRAIGDRLREYVASLGLLFRWRWGRLRLRAKGKYRR